VRNLDFSTSLLETVNAVIDFDTSRKTARFARVPWQCWVKEPQLPMILLRNTLRKTPPGTYDRWRTNPPAVPTLTRR
jgi:hypothetical protein